MNEDIQGNSATDNTDVKKNLMYSSSDDFYFYTYAIFLILDWLSCYSPRNFKDYRKLVFLVDFATDENLLTILEASKSRSNINRLDKEYLFRSYSNGLTKRSEVLKLLFRLEASGYIELEKGNLESGVNVSLAKDKLPNSFFDQNLFVSEKHNLERLSKFVQRVSVIRVETLIEKLYQDQGISTWAL
ncbi:hypothetical protein [Methylophilus aquaticus]|uniref:DUF4423 domain-containing protein n=1 Tax=Methylophilus aquaticus TaxID=1971610 RepID=A0ABT9JTQ0_9PROT|nr:hypothetical protein [Methylophilus aquaticus]MDP8567962.1 hypothetical protein [Methylophilus aquaticus]